MKMRIKIRFIKRKNDYLIQRKLFTGWKYIGYTVDMGYGSVRYLYCQDSKEKLLDEVLEKYYEVDKRFVEITEYPHLKIY
jgi:CRISPR/Cas system CSM-associated protein Csm3 (group 7 of RAMP superfamily)